jgi:hypothetical protein
VVKSPYDEVPVFALFRDCTDVRVRLRRGIQWDRPTASARQGDPPLRRSPQRILQRWHPVLRLGLGGLVGSGAVGGLRRF